uniref:CAZy families GH13 protein n=1 Tax=uncultured Sanguibacter sp. TaxID=435288 RepID=A0A060C0J9_9MICO|nr:CAZy families GH13 protein [uncultured Sanguibacter sp.]
MGEVWLADAARFARYLRSDEMHTAFNFDFMTQPWDAAAMRASIASTLAEHAPWAPRHVGPQQPRHHAPRHPLRP